MPHPPSEISSTTTPVHDQGQAFEEACRRRDYGALQVAVSGMDKHDACAHLATLFPTQSHRWFVRNFALLMSMDPDEFWRLAYKDETGDTAVANVMDPRPVAPTYRVLNVTDWTPEQINDLHYEDELTDDQYAADLGAWEERNAARNAARNGTAA